MAQRKIEEMDEEWKPVVGHENEYEVSNLGRVKSLERKVRLVTHGVETKRTVPERVLKPGCMNRFGHCSVAIGRGNTRTVHSLVAEAFIGPRPEKFDVAHLNGDGGDNRAENLAYVSRAENNHHMVHHGRRKLTVEQVRDLRSRHWPVGSQTKAARELGVSPQTLNNLLRGRIYAHV